MGSTRMRGSCVYVPSFSNRPSLKRCDGLLQDRTKPRALIIDGASLIAASGDKVLRRLVKLVRHPNDTDRQALST